MTVITTAIIATATTTITRCSSTCSCCMITGIESHTSSSSTTEKVGPIMSNRVAVTVVVLLGEREHRLVLRLLLLHHCTISVMIEKDRIRPLLLELLLLLRLAMGTVVDLLWLRPGTVLLRFVE